MDTQDVTPDRNCRTCQNYDAPPNTDECKGCRLPSLTRWKPPTDSDLTTRRCDRTFCGLKNCLDCYPKVAEPARYPDDNPKTRFGLAKPPIALIPGPALVQAAEAMRDGAKKYGPANWRDKPVTTSTYTSAAMRHLLAWIDGEETAPDSGVHHLGHVMGCVAILIDAQAQGTLNDDRPTAGRTGQLLADLTRPTN